MAATNYTPISLYYSTTASAAPTAGNLTSGELAINITDGKLFYKDNSGVVQTIAYKNTPISTLSGFGTGVATALGINTGSAGAFVVNGGALGTPSSGTLTNATGLPVSTGVSGFGTGVATALGVNTSSAGAFVVNGGALGTPSSGTLTNATGLPVSTGISGLGTGVATFLGTPSSANLAAAVTDETGSGALVFANSPTLVTPALGTPASGVLTNATGLPLTTGVTGVLPIANGGTNSSATATAGGVGYGTGTAHAYTAAGTSGQVLTSNGSGAPTWSNASSGTVTSVGMTVPAFLSVTGSPVTSSGTLALSLSGTALPVANGGTGQTSYTDGQLLIGNSTGNTLSKATLTAGSGITITNGGGSITIASSGGSGTVTSVGQTFTGGLISVAGSPVTTSGTLALTVAGTSGGIPYFSGASTWASSAALASNALMVGGGAGAAPATVTTGTGVVTALGVNTGSAGAFVVNGGALGTPSSGTLTNATGLPLTTGVTGVLPIANGGTNSSATATAGGVGYGTGTAHAFTAAGTSGQVLTSNGSSAPTWATATGGISYTRVTANTTLTNNQGVIADTTGGTFTVTLPATPSSGNQVWIADGGSWGTTNLTVGRNGSTIEGTAADLTLDISGVEIQMIYDGTTWQVYVLGGAAGVTTTGSGSTVLATSPTITTPTISGNETYTGSGGRILADFDNATVTNRRAFQTSTTNASTGIYALPNGTSTAASWQAANSADPTNCNKILIATNASTDVQLVSGVNGSNSYLPLSFYNSNAQKMQLSTAGCFGIGPAFSPTNNALLELAAGTTSVAPARLTSGTNLTSPVAGTIEYDGTNYYVTPTTGTTELRGIIPSTQQFVLSAAGSAIGPTISNFFGSNSAIQLAASTTYFIEAYCYFLKTTAGTATWAALFSSAPTVAHATLEYTPVTGFTTSTITGAMVNAEATANAVANMAFSATASLTSAVYHVAKFKIFVTTGAAPNLRFNLTQSAGTATPQAGSWYSVRKIATSTGNFIA